VSGVLLPPSVTRELLHAEASALNGRQCFTAKWASDRIGDESDASYDKEVRLEDRRSSRYEELSITSLLPAASCAISTS